MIRTIKPGDTVKRIKYPRKGISFVVKSVGDWRGECLVYDDEGRTHFVTNLEIVKPADAE